VSEVPLVPIIHEGDEWYEWNENPSEPRVMIRIAERDGRFLVEELRLLGGVSAERLRSVPLGRIEAAANALMHSGSGRQPGVPAEIPRELRLTSARGYPDGFYDAIAAAYRTLAHASTRPVLDLADANGVPVTTAQRWVREARARGKLPPGRPGKAG